MTSQSLLSDLRDFVQFATRQIDQGQGAESVEALVQQWRRDADFDETIGDVRQGLLDDAQGRGESVAETFASIRLNHGSVSDKKETL